MSRDENLKILYFPSRNFREKDGTTGHPIYGTMVSSYKETAAPSKKGGEQVDIHFATVWKFICSALASAAAYIWGPADEWLYALIAMIVLDYISGVIAAMINHELSSAVGFRGILKKVLFFILAGVSNIADTLIGLGGMGQNAVIGFLIANEGLSILENAGRCGLKKPQALIAMLKQLQPDEENSSKSQDSK